MNRLYLVRHGENPANLTKEFSVRWVDYSLTPKGILQAEQTAEYFKNRPIDAIYASPLKRTRETAEIIAAPLHLPVTILETLREVNVGSFEGAPVTADLWARHNAIVMGWMDGQPETRFPGGENYTTLLARAQASIERMMAGRDNQNIIAVGHGGMFTLTLKDLCRGVDVQQLVLTENHNCSITTIEVECTNGELVSRLCQWASVDHLQGAAAELVSGALQV